LEILPPFKPRTHSKWLQRYASFVASADRGAILEI